MPESFQLYQHVNRCRERGRGSRHIILTLTLSASTVKLVLPHGTGGTLDRSLSCSGVSDGTRRGIWYRDWSDFGVCM